MPGSALGSTVRERRAVRNSAIFRRDPLTSSWRDSYVTDRTVAARAPEGHVVNSQEREIISGIFQRLEQAASQPRDPETERFIADKIRQQPYAPYAMAQMIYVQEEAIKSLNQQVEELRAEVERPGHAVRRLPVEHLWRRLAAATTTAAPGGGVAVGRPAAARPRLWAGLRTRWASARSRGRSAARHDGGRGSGRRRLPAWRPHDGCGRRRRHGGRQCSDERFQGRA